MTKRLTVRPLNVQHRSGVYQDRRPPAWMHIDLLPSFRPPCRKRCAQVKAAASKLTVLRQLAQHGESAYLLILFLFFKDLWFMYLFFC